eukprot:1159872-Pelagomonas_calceolata.AAC.5
MSMSGNIGQMTPSGKKLISCIDRFILQADFLCTQSTGPCSLPNLGKSRNASLTTYFGGQEVRGNAKAETGPTKFGNVKKRFSGSRSWKGRKCEKVMA